LNLGRDFPIRAFVTISLSLQQKSLWRGTVISKTLTVERAHFLFWFLFWTLTILNYVP